MKQIRKNVFETNSSSTHSIVISKKNHKLQNKDLYSSIWRHDDRYEYEFGREAYRLVNKWDEKLAYAYLALKDSGIKSNVLKEFKKRVNTIYNEVVKELGEKPFQEVTPNFIFKLLDRKNSFHYIDHSENIAKKFINDCLTDDKFLKRFLFDSEDSYIVIGGDEYSGFYIKTIGFEYDYDYEYLWKDKDGNIVKDLDAYFEKYKKYPKGEYVGEFWNKLKEYEKTHDVYLKGN